MRHWPQNSHAHTTKRVGITHSKEACGEAVSRHTVPRTHPPHPDLLPHPRTRVRDQTWHSTATRLRTRPRAGTGKGSPAGRRPPGALPPMRTHHSPNRSLGPRTHRRPQDMDRRRTRTMQPISSRQTSSRVPLKQVELQINRSNTYKAEQTQLNTRARTHHTFTPSHTPGGYPEPTPPWTAGEGKKVRGVFKRFQLQLFGAGFSYFTVRGARCTSA